MLVNNALEDESFVPNLKVKYDEKYHSLYRDVFCKKNPMECPKLSHIVITMGGRELVSDPKALKTIDAELHSISGQKPQLIKAKKSISNFKLRAGMPLTLRVTLRGRLMYEFLERCVYIALPRIRDFKGFLPKGDGRGGVAFSITDHSIFPEIDCNRVDKARGVNIVISTTAKTPRECFHLLSFFRVPFFVAASCFVVISNGIVCWIFACVVLVAFYCFYNLIVRFLRVF